MLPETVPVISSVFRKTLYGQGTMQLLSQTIRQAVWLFVLVMTGCTLFLRPRGDAQGCLLLTFTGLILFLLLFEARGRYVYTCVPLLIVAATGAASRITPVSKSKKF